MNDYLQLSHWQVALAALLIVVNAVTSIAWKLGLERTLAVASVRTIVQLTLVGFVLQWVFRPEQPWYVVLCLATVMTLAAGISAAGQVGRSYRRMLVDSILSVWTSSWLVTAYVLLVVLQRGADWYQPQYLAPLLGMVLGNALNGISLGLGTFTESLITRRGEVEALLTLGATRWEAAHRPIRDAVRTGMVPIVNAMMVVGIVSLPGMMTGQLLSGTSPVDAVKYQVVVMFMIAAATALGTTAAVMLSYRRLFNVDQQFVVEALSAG
ncbi:MAG: iron export ABC transporter permease subunit FetB [Planctomycetota bacterium]